MKKKVDPRIRQLLENGVRNNHRSLLVLVGDKGRDQIANLHYILSKQTVGARPSVLWCYKKELGFSSNKKKRMKVIKKRMRQGLVDANKEPFDLFISSTDIRYTYYSESHKILGNTYGMCILQDFEALTPNLLARTIETVHGGGLIVLLVSTMTTLRKLYQLTMDSHARLRTEAHNKVVARFNERFILSLSKCQAALVADDELNVLPISSQTADALSATPGAASADGTSKQTSTYRTQSTADDPELEALKKSMADTLPAGPLVNKAKTLDQAHAILRFEEAIGEKTLRSTVALTASRGRGKSAALGLAVAAAVAHGYANIFVTAPSPENLRTFFAFLFTGFDALEYAEHTDYEIIQSTNPALNKAVVRVNIYRNHRQTVQYILPNDAPNYLSQAELLVIDEAAAIPLPVVQAMLGPYLVFMCSTITGYEGTGRSLSLKLLSELRQSSGSSKGRVFREVNMNIPIRYGPNDYIEKWLYELLCLEAGGVRQVLTAGAPAPEKCELYFVERDALFSYHKAAETFLHRVMGLFVSSHYKNQPNDLQMLSDAPAHMLFVLLAPTSTESERLPDVLCAIQLCLEGEISTESAKSSLKRGHRASGDLIPWTLSQQFQDSHFATLKGARIVRVATHPDVQSMGYGTRALKLLIDYFAKGKKVQLDDDMKDHDAENEEEEEEDDDDDDEEMEDVENDDGKKSSLREEIIGPRKKIPPLLRALSERTPESLDYLGVSYGLTQGLYNFWSRLEFLPLYTRLTPSPLTGEHTCIMATTSVTRAATREENGKWLADFHSDFRRRFAHLLGYEFRQLKPGLALAVLQPGAPSTIPPGVEKEETVRKSFSPYDARRLESYSKNLVDYHVIVDLLPRIAEMFALGTLPVKLSAAQAAILTAIGLQRKSVDDIVQALDIAPAQVLALLNKSVRKVATYVRKIEQDVHAKQVTRASTSVKAEAEAE